MRFTSMSSSFATSPDIELEEQDGNSPSDENGRNRAKDYQHIHHHLYAATRGQDQFLSEKTAAAWWKEALNEHSPDIHFHREIRPRMEKCRHRRERFDRVSASLERVGMSIMQPEKFWRMSHKERTQYLEKSEAFLENQTILQKRLHTLRTVTFDAFVKITHGRLKASSDRDIATLKQGLQHVALDAKEIEGWELFMSNAIVSAQSLYGRMMNQLITAQIDEHIISARVVKNIKNKFQDTGVDFKRKEIYVDETLPERIAEWRRVKQDRDDLAENPDILKLRDQVTRFDDFLVEERFIDLKYPERKALLDRVERALNIYVKMETLSSPMMLVQYHLNNHDWDAAEQSLLKAQKKDPRNEEILPLLKYVWERRQAEQMEIDEANDPDTINEELQNIVSQHMPTGAKKLYTRAMTEGWRVTKPILSYTRNRVWVREHGFSTNESERTMAESKFNKDKTREYIKDGHTRKREDLVIGGDTAQKSAIREESHKAQMLYIDPDGVEAVIDHAETHQEDHMDHYWTAGVLREVTYDAQAELVKNYHYKIKMGMMKLDKLGYDFSLSGPARRKNGYVSEPVQSPKPASHRSFSLAP